MKLKTQIKTMLAALTLVGSLLNAPAQPTAFTYQGRLNDNLTSNPVQDGFYDINFTNYDGVLPGGNVVASYNVSAVGVTNGLFSVAVDFGPGVFTGPDRWLELSVRTNGVGPFMTQSPRQRFLSAPYAIFANSASNLVGTLGADQLLGTLPGSVLVGADGSGLTSLDASELASGTVPDGRLASNVARTNQVWLLGGNGGTTAGAQFLGTTDNQALEIKARGQRVMRFEPAGGDSDDPGTDPDGAPNVVVGAANNFVAPGIVGATIAGGGATNFAAPNLFWGSNSVLSHYSSIGGGRVNTIGTNSTDSTIGGGQWNEIQAGSPYATVAGGAFHVVTNAPYATIGGGKWGQLSAPSATIAGGEENVIAAGAFQATVAGGYRNWIRTDANDSSIGGGGLNQIGIASSTAVIGGGDRNLIGTNAISTVIAGGFGNVILNNAKYATIPGGTSNSAASYCLAAGRGARALHQGTFAWADSIGTAFEPIDFLSTAPNQFLIRATGGVGIGTNNPQAQLHVSGQETNRALARLQNLEDENVSLALVSQSRSWRVGQNRPPDDHGSTDGFFIHDETANRTRLYINTSGNVGIGTNAPAARLDINGTTFLRGTATVGESASVNFGSQSRQMLNLYNATYGLGVQDSTCYFRTDSRFSWFRDGVHTNTQNDAGSGGTVLMTLTGSGLTVNGTFVSASDRNLKENFKPVDSRAALEKVVALPLSEWNYKDDEERSRHLGPMAQDFYAAFGVGPDDKHIATVDADGVALAAIQGLNEIVKEKDAKIGELEVRLTELEQIVRKLNSKGE